MAAQKLFLKLLLLSMCAAPLGALADPTYSLTFLPQNFYASGINNAGHVVGTAGGGAAIWTDTVITYLASVAPGSEGYAINNHDDIAGRFGIHGFVYSGGTLRDIDSGGSRSWATGINDAGRVSGTLRDFGNPAQLSLGFVWVDGAGLGTILTFGGYADFANAINNAGQVAGFASSPTSDFGDPERSAFLYQMDGSVANLGTLGGVVSEANDLNDAGQVVGWSETTLANEERPFLFAAGAGMVDLGSLGGRSGRANGINNAGMVVGMSDIGHSASFDYHAFLYAGGQMVDLNELIDLSSGWRLVSATDINDAQQILGRACRLGSSECRAVRLDMIPGVPEPGAWALLLAGLALVAARARPGLAARRRWRKLLLLPLLASPLAVLAEPTYTVRFLPADFSGLGMNHTGVVVGTYGGAAATWSETGIVDIGAIAPGSMGRAINNRGDIAGDWNGDAFLYSSGSLRNIGRLGIWDTSYATAINDAGQMAGNAYFGIGERTRGFVYSDGVVRNIPTFGGDWSWTNSINSAGQVVGIATIDSTDFIDPTRHAILYQDRITTDLGTLGGLISEANDINDVGQIVGMSETTPDFKSGEPHPFLYQGGVMSDLGFLGTGIRGRANSINNLGMIVGASEWSIDQPDDLHAFLYANHAMVDLNSLIDPATGWLLVSARDINDAGQILATACREGACVNVRLDMIPGVPEPGAWGMLVVGLALLGSRRRANGASATFR